MAMQARRVQIIVACNLIARLARSKPSVNFNALDMLTCAACSGHATQPSFNQPWSETTRQAGSLAHCRQPEGPADRAAIAGAERRSEIVRRPAPTNDAASQTWDPETSRCANAIPQRYRDSHRNPLKLIPDRATHRPSTPPRDTTVRASNKATILLSAVCFGNSVVRSISHGPAHFGPPSSSAR